MTAAEATPELDIAADRDDRAFLGHPKGLGYLAFTETWERFSYYGMQTLLVLYMVQELLLPGHIENVAFFDEFRTLYGDRDGQPLASAIFGTYTALVYLTPILGGFLADRFLGRRLAVTIGAITMAAGHFMMAFETSFLFALLALIVGNGLFKGNIASQVGALYAPSDLRRATAFQIFYLGINAAVIVSPIVVGTLGQRIGWHWGFGAAGIGMLVGLGIYLAGQKYLPTDEVGRSSAAARAERPQLSRADWGAVLGLVLLIPVMAVALQPNQQIFNAYLVWGDRSFDFNVGGFDVPSSWLITLDAVTSVSFLALVAIFYSRMGKRGREPDEITKMIIGSAFSIAGVLCLFMAAATAGPGEKISLFWPVMFHLLNSVGFAHMLPVSLALFAKVAPKSINATVIGLYYLAFFTANALVGYTGGWLEAMPTTTFWLIHAGFAAVGLVAFVLFKLTVGRRFADAPAADPLS
jgi:POT family proton-dependent oligopeptide transporter